MSSPSIPKGFQLIAGGQRSATTGEAASEDSSPEGIAALQAFGCVLPRACKIGIFARSTKTGFSAQRDIDCAAASILTG